MKKNNTCSKYFLVHIITLRKLLLKEIIKENYRLVVSYTLLILKYTQKLLDDGFLVINWNLS